MHLSSSKVIVKLCRSAWHLCPIPKRSNFMSRLAGFKKKNTVKVIIKAESYGMLTVDNDQWSHSSGSEILFLCINDIRIFIDLRHWARPDSFSTLELQVGVQFKISGPIRATLCWDAFDSVIFICALLSLTVSTDGEMVSKMKCAFHITMIHHFH